ncbi:glutaminase A [Anaerobranca gottschalkii]|uniref:Glutaminase n=1 Tax=Anaerobranca gottschalkii DSM 13577 TaxID=1120990 RepID=A0A1I0BA11_9FIRM|nr:glutaminase A [Anaerobranca gottschalkii]SET03645.1 L-glutaminase [Anaerobranca gottschalkii DSM 13577]
MDKVLQLIYEKNKKYCSEGKVASYIPALAKQDKEKLGIAIMGVSENGREIYTVGDVEEKFTMQSISKVFTLMLAIMDNGQDYVFSKVGMEPTGDPFNSIVKLETMNPSKPLNPMINAGAIAISSMIKGKDNDERFKRIVQFLEEIIGEKITFNEEVYLSEKATGNRNRAAAYFMKDVGVIQGDVEEILDLYFRHCSLEVNCIQLAKLAGMLANQGVSVVTGKKLVSKEITQLVKSFMVTCGMYNASGEFAIKVGIPAKSGVGGGIMAVVPNKYGVALWGPALDRVGNSIAGVKILEDLSKEFDWSIF